MSVAIQLCSAQVYCAHIPRQRDRHLDSTTLNHASMAAAHSPRREWVQLQPGKRVKGVSARRGLCSMLLSSGTGSSRVLGRGSATAAAGLGSPIPPSVQPEAIWRHSRGGWHRTGRVQSHTDGQHLRGHSGLFKTQGGPEVCRAGAEVEALALCGSRGTGQHWAAPGSACSHPASAVPGMRLPGSWATRILISLAFLSRVSLLTTEQPRVF